MILIDSCMDTDYVPVEVPVVCSALSIDLPEHASLFNAAVVAAS